MAEPQVSNLVMRVRFPSPAPKIMTKKIKKFILPGTTLIISLYLSVLFAIGVIIGYLGTNLFHKKFIRTGRIGLLTFNLGKWRIHLHHWLLASLLIFVGYIAHFISSLPIFFIGILGGLIFHDLYSDKTWYKVVYRKKPKT